MITFFNHNVHNIQFEFNLLNLIVFSFPNYVHVYT